MCLHASIYMNENVSVNLTMGGNKRGKFPGFSYIICYQARKKNSVKVFPSYTFHFTEEGKVHFAPSSETASWS